jgi:hypothetical protein
MVVAVNARKPYTFWLDGDLAEGLKAVKDRDGINESEQIRRAIREWLRTRGLKVKTSAAIARKGRAS